MLKRVEVKDPGRPRFVSWRGNRSFRYKCDKRKIKKEKKQPALLKEFFGITKLLSNKFIYICSFISRNDKSFN